MESYPVASRGIIENREETAMRDDPSALSRLFIGILADIAPSH